MKKILRGVMVVAAVFLCSLGRAGNSDFEIHVQPQKLGENSKSGNTTASAKELWLYEVTVENKSFKPLSGVEVKYVLFYKPEKLGVRTEEKLSRTKGTAPITELRSHEKQTFKTETVELQHTQLINDYYYPTGGRQAAQDRLSGIWIRIFQNGQQIGEYANPTNLMREKWE